MLRIILRPLLLSAYYAIIVFCILGHGYFKTIDSLGQKIIILLIVVSGEFIILFYNLLDTQVRYSQIVRTWNNTKKKSLQNNTLDLLNYNSKIEFLLKTNKLLTTKQTTNLTSIKLSIGSFNKRTVKYQDIKHINY